MVKQKKDTKEKLTTLEMEIALMENYNVRQNLIVPNVSWGLLPDFHECDLLILRKSMIGTEIEIKVSKADLKKDKSKKHDHTHELIKNFYFAVPFWLKEFALEHIPDKAGLITVRRYESNYYNGYTGKDYTKVCYDITEVKPCNCNENFRKWSDDEKQKLQRLAAMRILTLKKNVFKLKEDK